MNKEQTIRFLEKYREDRATIYKFYSLYFGAKRSQEMFDWLPRIDTYVSMECKAALDPFELPYSPEEPPDYDDEFEADYAKLFYGVGKKTIPLAESAYVNAHGLLCQEAWRDIQALYKKHGYSVAKEFNMEADSLSVELAFADLLLTTKASYEDYAELLNNHLYPFYKTVYDEIERQTQNNTMAEFSTQLMRFLKAERHMVNTVLAK